MEKPQLDKIQFAAQQFKGAIEKTVPGKVMVCWSVIEQRGVEMFTSSGITVSEQTKMEELALQFFHINGRAFGMTRNPNDDSRPLDKFNSFKE